MAIDVEKELTEAHEKLPIIIDSPSVPLDMQMRVIALTLAQRHVGDTCVKEGALYNALKMDNKLGNVVTLDDVIRAALVMERYLWGEWSKGIADHAIEAMMTEAADAIEEEFKKGPSREKGDEEPPPRPSSGGTGT